MNTAKLLLPFLYSVLLIILIVYQPYREALKNKEKAPIPIINKQEILLPIEKSLYKIPVRKDVPLSIYFNYIDSLVSVYDSLLPYNFDEHLLLQANDWIIDTLENTD